MLYARLKNEVLAARDGRHVMLQLALRPDREAILSLALNIPGREKQPPGSRALFGWALRQIQQQVPGLRKLYNKPDGLGSFAIFATGHGALETKRACLTLEEAHPFARLIDLDVYDCNGNPVSRSGMGLPQRKCLLCDEPARECIRLGRHQPEELTRKIYELLETVPR